MPFSLKELKTITNNQYEPACGILSLLDILRPLIEFSCNSKKTNVVKYQGVKEFHMLAHIGCYCNIMVFSFKFKVTYYHPLNQWLLVTF